MDRSPRNWRAALDRLAAGRPWRVSGLLPYACLLCEAACGDEPLCPACATFLPGARRPRCEACARPWRTGTTCATCRRDPPPWHRTVTAADYRPPLDRALTALKFGGQAGLARGLGRLLGRAWRDDDGVRPVGPIDALVPVPLSRERLALRGFNQAALIAAAVRQAAGRRAADVPGVAVGWLIRRRDTVAQSRLALADRRANVDHGFVATRRLDGLSIAVVDDVMTTGATLAAAAVALQAAGATRVVNLVVARTA